MSDSKFGNFIKGSAILVLANMMIKAINFFLLPLYTKYFTPTELVISYAITNVIPPSVPFTSMRERKNISAKYSIHRW